MAGKVHGQGTVLKLDDAAGALQDISSFASSTRYSPKTDRPDTQTFGQVAKRREVVGLRDGGALPIEGFLLPAAATKVHGRNVVAMLGQFDIGPHFKSGSIKRSVDLPETQTFGDAWRERDVVGLMDGAVSLGGFFDSAAGASYPVLKAQLAAANGILTLGFNGRAIGAPVDLVRVVNTDIEIPSTEEAVTEISANFLPDDRIELGVSLHDHVAETVPAVPPLNFASVDEQTASANGGVGHLHVSASAATGVVVKIQHSVDNSVWVDLITFAAYSAPTSERVELAAGTTVNRYVRAIISAGTNASTTFHVAFARRGATYYSGVGTYRFFVALFAHANSQTFELGPEGGTAGKQKITGEARVSSIEVSFSEEDVVKLSGELMCTGAVNDAGTF